MRSSTKTQPASLLLESWASELPTFWFEDLWHVTKWFRSEPGSAKEVAVNFGQLSESIAAEMKFVCWQKVSNNEWTITKVPSSLYRFKKLIWYLEQTKPQVGSMLDRTVAQWELSIRTFFIEKGLWRERVSHGINAAGELIPHQRSDPVFYALHATLATLRTAYDGANGVSEYDKDIWDVRKLGFLVTPGRNGYKLNFTPIKQPWLAKAIKQFCRYWLEMYSTGDCMRKLAVIVSFSRYLGHAHPDINPTAVDRTVMLGYISWLTERGLAEGTIVGWAISARTFVETCAEFNIAAFPERRLVFEEDLPRIPKRFPRFIPEEVREQLIANVEALPVHFGRMLLIFLATGMRISECLTLKLSGLQRDHDGDWILHYYQHKVSENHQVPVSEEVAQVIIAQMGDVKARWGDATDLLFPSTSKRSQSNGKPFTAYGFACALNKLAYKRDIRDATGQPVHFSSHQFRHTVATRLLNKGMSMPVVQEFLGIKSTKAAAVYAKLHDETVLAEFLKYSAQTVDINGTVVNDSPDDPDLAWVTHHVHGQTLSNGRCGLPPTEKCPHGNACLTCASFRTDVRYLPLHLKQRDETRLLIQANRAQGYERQAEANAQIEGNLTNIITVLEQQKNE